MKPSYLLIFSLLALSGAQALAQDQAAPGAAEVYIVPGIGKHKIPQGVCPQPVWPREALRYEIEGVATIRFKLSPDGRVSEAAVARSSGWTILDDATIRYVMSCAYTPQQAAEVQGRVLPTQFDWTLEGRRVYAGILPGTCAAVGRFDGFQPLDRQASDSHGIKVRFLIDRDGKPRGTKPEGNIDPETADQVAAYLDTCRFAYDPQEKGERTDTMHGRVLLR